MIGDESAYETCYFVGARFGARIGEDDRPFEPVEGVEHRLRLVGGIAGGEGGWVEAHNRERSLEPDSENCAQPVEVEPRAVDLVKRRISGHRYSPRLLAQQVEPRSVLGHRHEVKMRELRHRIPNEIVDRTPGGVSTGDVCDRNQKGKRGADDAEELDPIAHHEQEIRAIARE